MSERKLEIYFFYHKRKNGLRQLRCGSSDVEKTIDRACAKNFKKNGNGKETADSKSERGKLNFRDIMKK